MGFAHSQPQMPQHDQNRTELLKLLLTCFSDAMYLPPGKLADPLYTLIIVYSRVLATQQPTMLVGLLVGRSPFAFLAFLAFSGVFCITAPAQMIE